MKTENSIEHHATLVINFLHYQVKIGRKRSFHQTDAPTSFGFFLHQNFEQQMVRIFTKEYGCTRLLAYLSASANNSMFGSFIYTHSS